MGKDVIISSQKGNNLEIIKITNPMGLEGGGSAVKSICSFRGPKFIFQHLFQAAHNSLELLLQGI